MSEQDYYEIVRQKLKLGDLYAPKHEKIRELMKIFWNEKEIKVLSYFEAADKYISLRELSKKSGIPKEKLRAIIGPIYQKGTISMWGTKYGLIPLLPGIFEKYFIARNDTEENQRKASEIYRWLIKNFLPTFFLETNLKIFRPRLPIDAKEKLIEINESLDVESQIVPHELMSQLIDKYDIFSVIPCQCRLIGDYTGEPCTVASPDMGCFIAGDGARGVIAAGGPEFNREEAREYLRRTEKAGLIHSCIPDTSIESTLFVCNCCGCHCASLMAAKEHKYVGTLVSNYLPKINNELCTKCEVCMNKCQMGAIYHRLPYEADKSDERMIIREEYCLGCGVCATNCPNNAIKLIKVRDNISKEKHKIGTKTFLQLLS